MSEKDNGGPAFPRAAGDYNGTRHGNAAQEGLSLRDYFAAKALPSVYEAAIKESAEGSCLFHHPDWRDGLAMDAYMMADAMLKARGN